MSQSSEPTGTPPAPPEPREGNLAAQLALYEVDLKRHEDALNDLGRTETAIRGFAITGVAALLAAAYASGENLLGIVALVAAGYFAYLDYYSSRLDAEIKRRVDFLSGLAQTYRKTFVGAANRRRKAMLRLRVDLRSFAPFGEIPTKPVLSMAWRNRQARRSFEKRQSEAGVSGGREATFKPSKGPGLGPFKQFCFLYVILGAIALAAAVQIDHSPQERIILCRPPDRFAVAGEAVELDGCRASTAAAKRPAPPRGKRAPASARE